MTANTYKLILKKSPGTVPGEEKPAEHSITAIKIKEVQKQGNTIEGASGRNVYLLTGNKNLPSPGDLICDGGKEFEITETEVCRDLDGNIRAVRCTTLN